MKLVIPMCRTRFGTYQIFYLICAKILNYKNEHRK